MPVIGLRKLSRETREVLEQLETSREPVIVSRRGRPIAILLPADREALADAAIALSPELRESLEEADEALATGQTESLDQVLAGLGPTEEGETHEFVTTNYDQLIEAVGLRLSESALPTLPKAYLSRTQLLNTRLFDALFSRNLQRALGEVQVINHRLLSAAGGSEHLEVHRYLTMLEGVVEAERTHGEDDDEGAEGVCLWRLSREPVEETP